VRGNQRKKTPQRKKTMINKELLAPWGTEQLALGDRCGLCRRASELEGGRAVIPHIQDKYSEAGILMRLPT
jgi:hypothetical protein